MLKLIDLQPRWLAEPDFTGVAQGVSFLCPHCRTTRIGVWFKQPIGDGPSLASLQRAIELHPDHHHHGLEWGRTGETVETLTLSPSIDVSGTGHWHGFIRDGEVT